MKTYTLYFAQAYGSGNYGSGTYACTSQQQQAGTCATGTTANSGSGLTNTGIGIVAIVTLACLIIFLALIVRIWRRKPTPAVDPVEAKEESGDNDPNTQA